jgi:hypothetical protein
LVIALFDAALRYADLGYRVFPCAPSAKTPLTEHGFHDATTDFDQIDAWWQRWPQANIGLPTEGLVVIDVDGSDNPWLANRPDRTMELACAPISLTPGGGRHYIFRQLPGGSWRSSAGKLAPKVDVRADGGYIVLPPSILTEGRVYRWAEGLCLDIPPDRLPEPPRWLADELDRLATTSPTLARVAAGCEGGNAIPSGLRNATLARLAGTMRRAGMGANAIAAALRATNATRCNPPLSDDEVGRIAESIARYEPDQITVAVVESHWAQVCASDDCPVEPPPKPPEPVGENMLRVPGFVSEVMDYCLETAPYPNVAMSFAGALALQALLAGRKVRDSADNRTNVYLLGLAHSSAGKDWIRKLNTKILHAVGMLPCLGDRLTSGEGIQGALHLHPCMLFQSDEIDGLLQSINKAKDARHEGIMNTLLSMYSSANSIFAMRHKADNPNPGAIDQPHLVLFGSAIPNHYYGALSERMLTNGFLARQVVIESGPRSEGQDSGILDVTDRIRTVAQWWANYRPGNGNLDDWHPVPTIVPYATNAREILVETRRLADAEYSHSEEQSDPVGTTVWGRVTEHARKLALIYAVSENYRAPEISRAAITWASEFVIQQTRRMLFMAQNHVADNPFHAECLRLMQKLREAPDLSLPHSVLLKRMKVDAVTFQKLIVTLSQQGDVETTQTKTNGRPALGYRLIRA